jgi:polyisoprenoid-binding protein YceI/mono/diheme cytochrome c family protein
MSGSESYGQPEKGYADASPPRPSWWRRAARTSRSHWLLSSLAVVLVVALAGAVYVWARVRPLLNVSAVAVSYTVPDAPHLVAGNNETVYRIDPTHSSLTYSVAENVIGQTAHHASGSTNGIAGDLALNSVDPSSSRVGKVVANVEQLHSDNSLRDAQIRQRYLDSQAYPLVSFSTTHLSGLPSSIVDGHSYSFTMSGNLTVRGVTAPATWDVTAKVAADGVVDATATTTVKMSTFGVGPINLAGLVSTGDDVGLTFKLTALDPSKHAVPTTITPPPGAPHAGTGASFKSAVQPILEQNCASCHAPGQVGAAHWELKTAGDAAQIADGLKVVTQAKYMPPWPASSLGVPLLHSKAMSQSDINTIASWAAAGGKLDEPASTPVKPAKPKPGTLPRQDVVMQMPQAYTGSLANTNDYRCFVLDPHITKPTYMTGYTVTPGHPTEIHHAQIFHIDAGQATVGNQMSGSDGKPGWSCYTGPNLPDPDAFKNFNSTSGRRKLHEGLGGGFTGQPGLVAGWVPGQDPVIYPHDSGILLEPGDELVLQIHYHYDSPPIPDRSTVSLQLTPGTDKVKPIQIVNPIAPVEIPCMPGVTAPLCNRNAALADDARLYGPAGSFIEPGLLGLCGTTYQQLAAQFQNGIAHTTCNYTVPFSGDIVGAMGHMHTLGKSFRFTLDPGTAKQKVLLDIPVWNFDWQMNYELATPLHVTKGEVIQMSCSWDRSLDPNRQPKYIVFAEGTEDEMCFGTYAMIPDDSP